MKYIIFHSDSKLLMPIVEGNFDTKIFVPKGVNVNEFDSRDLAEDFIKSNKLEMQNDKYSE